MTRKQVALIAWLCLPVLAVAALCYIMATNLSLESRAKNREMFPPRGAGANDTGGVNAVGELLHGQKANHGTPEGREAEPPAAPTTLRQPELLDQGFVLIVTDRSGKSGANSPIHLMGTLNGWNPHDSLLRLTQQQDQRWRIHVKPTGARTPIEFKFTRGSVDRIEVAASLQDITNRTLAPIDMRTLAPGQVPEIELVVDRWADERNAAPAPPRTP